MVLGTLAEHLLGLHQQRDHREFLAVARAIERLHLEGDDYVRNAATIGFLEGIQNVWGNSGTDPEDFFPLLLPESARWWKQLNLFWEGKIPYVGATIGDQDNSAE